MVTTWEQTLAELLNWHLEEGNDEERVVEAESLRPHPM